MDLNHVIFFLTSEKEIDKEGKPITPEIAFNQK